MINQITLSQRVAVFVDVQNLYYSARHLYNTHVHFGNLLKDAVGDRQLARAFAYVVRADMPEEQSFFDALVKVGYEVKMKDIQVFAGGARKGDWDVGMSMDVIRLAERVDIVVLVTGDGDFEPLVRYLKETKGCRVEVMAFGRSTSGKLIAEADGFLDLDKNAQRYVLARKRTGQRSGSPRTT